ncbi:MAG TPA: hypothetical protein VM452_19355 [Caulifigura sp.]|jgi:hypothetical protein|nr:hypothetical protein [Caulifigura sp.]
MPPLQGVGVGQIHGNQPQGVQNAPRGLNGQAVNLGPGQTIRRALQEAFSEVKGFFKGIGERIQAHHESNVEKARTKAADKSAGKFLDTLLRPNVSERKVLSELLTLCDKSAKLDPGDPEAKAVDFLENKLQGLTDPQKNTLLNGNYGMLKNLLTESGRAAREKSNLVSQALHDTGLVGGNAPVLATGPSATELLAGRILDRMQNQGNTAFTAERNQIDNDLTTYFTSQEMTAQLMFRTDAPVTKAMGKHLSSTNGHAIESMKQQTIDVAKSTGRKTGEMEIGSYGKLDLSKISTKQFNEILNGSEKLLESMMGGATDEGARRAANELAPNVVRLLQVQDQQVNQHLNGDMTARENAFVGTLFLRSLTASLTNAQPGQTEQHAAIMKVFSQVVTFTLNQSDGIDKKMAGLSTENLQSLQTFMDNHAATLTTFRDTVLARTDV